MSPEHAAALRRNFPHLTVEFAATATTSPPEPFAIADGWVQLFWQLLAEVEAERLKLPPEEAAKVKLIQVKEKWGGLRVYASGRSAAIQAVLDRIEELSFGVCEKCGATGDDVFPRGGGWVRTLCPNCPGA